VIALVALLLASAPYHRPCHAEQKCRDAWTRGNGFFQDEFEKCMQRECAPSDYVVPGDLVDGHRRLQAAETGCAGDIRQCSIAKQLRSDLAPLEEAEERKRSSEEQKRQRTAEDETARVEREEKAKAEAADKTLKAKCGANYHKLRVGMAFTRARECSGLEFSARAEDRRGIDYDAVAPGDFGTGHVRVERGVVVRWQAP
jgi:hypothetical protein